MNQEKVEYIKNWLFRANEDIAVIDNLINAGTKNYTSTICFHAQQASEKFLKAFLVNHDVDFPRTHDLDFLLLECQKINTESFKNLNLGSLTLLPVEGLATNHLSFRSPHHSPLMWVHH